MHAQMGHSSAVHQEVRTALSLLQPCLWDRPHFLSSFLWRVTCSQGLQSLKLVTSSISVFLFCRLALLPFSVGFLKSDSAWLVSKRKVRYFIPKCCIWRKERIALFCKLLWCYELVSILDMCFGRSSGCQVCQPSCVSIHFLHFFLLSFVSCCSLNQVLLEVSIWIIVVVCMAVLGSLW